MKYKVSCYNGGPIFGWDWVFIKPDETIVEVEGEDENRAIIMARGKVTRDYYKIIEVI